ncbi:hypothetical protein SPRG_06271 [Saprolegnia parasitica CBS 223.65]|uniref:Uncharacterized protein n=1 Tax=Saprolegnia parasitica (strain CBS 223.65) TaxID=695850 RepID=A0A067CN62_SAPPC|nr:hypothetical protein SPRG_06271 [Saprolegnia parasitica CBS 223.65]KDO28222.1 hypothetical protein SPRG_06271 [Saprolegnia parasitica CBS 223.65]|eukprot:XP_012201047.1 hypothetical protein SPRG_06271 [Saprolegnia parasitica CBS 223.65]
MDISRLLNPVQAAQWCDSATSYYASRKSTHAVQEVPQGVQWMRPHFTRKRTHVLDDAGSPPQRPRLSAPLAPTMGHTSPRAGRIFSSSSNRGWRAAFFNVGFDANNIFNQICPLRKGRWRHEEEAYAIELVKMVHANRLPLKFCQSLRTFLAQKLHSDEMRVLKKVGNSDAFAFARQRRAHSIETSALHGYENERSIEPLETLRRAFLKSVQIEVTLAMPGSTSTPIDVLF